MRVYLSNVMCSLLNGFNRIESLFKTSISDSFSAVKIELIALLNSRLMVKFQ